MRRDPRAVGKPEKGSPLPIRATAIVLGSWVGVLVILAFVVVPVLFAICGPAPGGPGP